MSKTGNVVGLVGWRGMVGSVLMDRMQAEGDFDSSSPCSSPPPTPAGKAPAQAKNETTLKDAHDIDALKKCDIIITAQGGDYTTEVFPKLRAAGWNGHWIDAASTLRMKDDAIIILDPVNLPVIQERPGQGRAQLDWRQLHGELHADGRGRALQGRPGRVDELHDLPGGIRAAAPSICASC
jgi:aspartate-semialdehyde dehydrogenase